MLVAGSLLAQSTEEVTFKSYWHNGFNVTSSDNNFKLLFGGRLQTDWAFFGNDSELDNLFGGLNNGVEFRRARFFSQGTVYSKLNYKLEFDFSNGAAVFKDAYIGLSGLKGIGNIRAGHIKEPMRIEVLTSSKYITFMERAPGVDFVPERNMGIMVFNHTKRLTWAAGVFRRGDSQGNDKVANDELNLTGRLTFLALNNTDKKQMLHFGLAGSYRKPDSGAFEIKAKPAAHLAPTFVNTGAITGTSHINVLQAEAAFVSGPFSLQGEFITSTVTALNEATSKNEDYTFSSYYAYASYFLTGETRKYSAPGGFFSRVSPKKNFGQGGSGAWELALRYSKIDLTDKTYLGGNMSEITVGLNWYLNPVSRFMFNYVNADLKEVGKANIVETRFQVDF